MSDLTLSDLHPKMKLSGTVTKIELFGAFVDVGVGVDGLVHISQLKSGRVKNARDVVSEGQEVTVWVRQADHRAGRIDLTMIKPPDVDWDELRVDQVYTGRVIRVEKYGAFVDFGAERPGLVHVSELSSDYVKSPGDVVKRGDQVEVKVIGVDRRKRQIDLSMKALVGEAPAPEVENDEEPMTAMAFAFQRAMEEADSDEGSSEQKHRKGERSQDKRRQEQEELLRRTLEQQPQQDSPGH